MMEPITRLNGSQDFHLIGRSVTTVMRNENIRTNCGKHQRPKKHDEWKAMQNKETRENSVGAFIVKRDCELNNLNENELFEKVQQMSS